MRNLLKFGVVLVAIGCEGDASPGTLDVSWRIGRQSCREAGVSKVQVELHDFDGAEAAASTTAACEANHASIEDVRPGDYALLLKGLDADGCWTHSARRDDVSVDSGDDNTVASLPLLRRIRPLKIRWPFANELDCTGNAVEQVEVTIEVDDTFARTDVFRCEGLARKVTDIPRGALRVWIYAVDADKQAVAYGIVEAPEAVFDRDPCADEIDIRVALSGCDRPGCE